MPAHEAIKTHKVTVMFGAVLLERYIRIRDDYLRKEVDNVCGLV